MFLGVLRASLLLFFATGFFIASAQVERSTLQLSSSKNKKNTSLKSLSDSKEYSSKDNIKNSSGQSGIQSFASPEFFDYSKMPVAVQKQIDLNKINNHPPLFGIAKVFSIQFPVCKTRELAESKLGFLRTEKEYISLEFISSGLIKIFVQPSFNSVHLKNKLTEKKIAFSFEDETYTVNKLK